MSDFGSVTFRCAGRDVRATLRADHVWAVACDDPRVTDAIRPILEEIAARDHGPADGFYGPRQLRAVAELFGGTVKHEPRAETLPDRVY